MACSDKDDPEYVGLIGTWKLVEILADPGDGSGTFYPVESEKTMLFLSSGMLTSNGNLCSLDISADNPTTGSYSKIDKAFSSSDCSNPDYAYPFEQQGNFLIVRYPCFEACQAKYQKQ